MLFLRFEIYLGDHKVVVKRIFYLMIYKQKHLFGTEFFIKYNLKNTEYLICYQRSEEEG